MEIIKNGRCVFISSAVVMATLFFMASASKADVLFIVNKSVPVETLKKSEIKKIFLGDNPVWPNGEEIKLVTQVNTDIQKEFTITFTQRSASQFSNHWRKVMFSGKGMIPESVQSDHAVINFVKKTEGAIGYISPQSVTKDVKPVTISE